MISCSMTHSPAVQLSRRRGPRNDITLLVRTLFKLLLWKTLCVGGGHLEFVRTLRMQSL